MNESTTTTLAPSGPRAVPPTGPGRARSPGRASSTPRPPNLGWPSFPVGRPRFLPHEAPTDIASVHIWLAAELRFSDPKQRLIPRLHRRVDFVSADAIWDDRLAPPSHVLASRSIPVSCRRFAG